MKTILKSFAVCLALLAGYHLLSQRLPRDLRNGGGVGSQAEQNLMRAQGYVHSGFRPRVVVAGSSISARLKRHPADWYNLSFAGGSAFTAMEILLRCGKLPDVVLVETNVLTIDPDERMLRSLFFPPMRKARDRFAMLRETGKPQHVLLRALKQSTDGEAEAAGPAISEELFRHRVNERLKQLADPLPAKKLEAMVARLQPLVGRLEAAGVRVVFFEAPEYAAAMQMPQPESIRQRLQEAFPPTRYAWVPPQNASQYTTTDVIHLAPESANRYVSVLSSFVDSVASQRSAHSTTLPAASR